MTEDPGAIRARRGKFVLHKTSNGFYFNLYGANGECISTSEMYESKQSAERGIRAVVQNAGLAAIEEPDTE